MSCVAMASVRAVAGAAPMARFRVVAKSSRRHVTSFRFTRLLSATSATDAPHVTAKPKVVVITGANTGLGFISAREIAAKGHVVVLAVRDLRKGEKAVADIKDHLSVSSKHDDERTQLHVMRLDLSDLQSIDQFVTEFKEKYSHCDVLMNNAGVMAIPNRELTVNGIEKQMGTNHMGHFYLTERMMPLLFAAEGRPRVVNLSSVAHEWGQIDFENVNSDGFFGYLGSGWLTYGRTKLANLYFTYELHRRLRHFGGDGNRVDVNAVHPGVVDTELPRSLSLNFYPALKEIGGLITPEQGARGQIELAIGDAFENVSGKYVAEKSGANKKGVHEITESSK